MGNASYSSIRGSKGLTLTQTASINGSAFSKWRALARDEGATTAMEFGLLVSVWIFMTFIVLDSGFYFFQQAALDYATRIASRPLLTGSSGTLSANTFGNLLCTNVYGLIPCNQLSFTVQSAVSNTFTATQTSPGFANITAATTTPFSCQVSSSGTTSSCGNGGFSAGSDTDSVLVQVAYARQYLFGDVFMASFAGSSPAMTSTLPLEVEAY